MNQANATLSCILVATAVVGLTSWTAAAPVNDRSSAVSISANDVVLVDGFRLDLVYSVPAEQQGSWVSLTTDHLGRLIVSDQEGQLYRISLGAQASSTEVERLPVKIGCAHGLLYAYDSLYVTVNTSRQAAEKTGYQSGLYRLTDRDRDDQFDEIILLRKLRGMSEHGPHGLQLGPDGRIYLISGNNEKIGDGISERSPFRNWADDLLVPSKGNGLLPAGWVMRTDEAGETWELVCGGFRNPYDIAFDANGELFTCDADSESDIGTGWYRPTRINHIVSAGEYGWRYDGGAALPYGKWPAYYPDSVGSVVDFGVGSPAGLVMGTGARFPAKYQRALFSCDWAWGKIYAVHLRPLGASYTATYETFLEGTSLPITDMVVHPDGDMYFICGGRKAASGLFRVSYVGDESVDRVGPVVDEKASDARRIRRKLERFHGRQDAQAITEAWPYLGHPDRAL
ncbi:MAG: PQQ-dependent sugar dehydrogenase, partial [Pirellulaceae bacterium]|nr:PQQ-dependent sugar dehydrogenase [Pirellulaceae bacterium]